MATLDERRRRYERDVRGLRAVADGMLAEGATEEDVARQLVGRRNELKRAVRADDPAAVQQWAERRNQKRYGNPVGPTPEQQLAKYGSWPAVIEAACRHAKISR